MMHLVDEPGTRRLFVATMTGPIFGVSHDGKTVTEYVERARNALKAFPGVTVIDHRADEGYVTPIEAAGEDNVYISRIRRDPSAIGRGRNAILRIDGVHRVHVFRVLARIERALRVKPRLQYLLQVGLELRELLLQRRQQQGQRGWCLVRLAACWAAGATFDQSATGIRVETRIFSSLRFLRW